MASVTSSWYKSSRRQDRFVPGQYYRRGRVLVQRKRRCRSDCGGKRKSYSRKKKFASLRKHPNARQLVRLEPQGGAAVAE